MRKLRPQLVNWKEISKNMERVACKLKKEMGILSTYLLPTYETSCMKEYQLSKKELPISSIPEEDMESLSKCLERESRCGYLSMLNHLR
jgi:hypothetical protein